MRPVDELLDRWRADAATQGRYADTRGVEITRLHIAELESALAAEQDELITRAAATKEFDVHADTLTRLVRQRKLTNYGKTNAPLYRRGELVAIGLPLLNRTEPDEPNPPATGPRGASLLEFKGRVLARGRKGG